KNFNSFEKEPLLESLYRDLILFSFLLLLILSQNWENIFLLLFPIITFSFGIFFRSVSVNKWRIKFENSQIVYNPLGLEKKNANRFIFCALLQLILIFWYGAESLCHPQLVDNYYFFFVSILVFTYTFGFYWIFIDLWKYCGIELILDGIDVKENQKKEKDLSKNLENIISFLKIKNFKRMSIISFITFLIINSLNLIISLFIQSGIVQGFEYMLPGTGIEDSEPIYFSYFIFIILLFPPILSILLLVQGYKDIIDINKQRLEKALKPLPKNVQIKVIENLKAINNRIKEELKLE
ncbi:MAG: hypothetical protein ACTSQJ_16895, partial [Promethearchaeota archaeon]